MSGIPDGLAMNLSGGIVLVGPVGARYLASALRAVEQVQRRDGIGAPPAFVALRDVFLRALAETRSAAFPDETTKVRQLPDLSQSGQGTGTIGAEELARRLNCSAQWARALLRKGEFETARLRSRTWEVDTDEVAAWLHVHDRADAPSNGSGYATRIRTAEGSSAETG